jgi:hypothetical protein
MYENEPARGPRPLGLCTQHTSDRKFTLYYFVLEQCHRGTSTPLA